MITTLMTAFVPMGLVAFLLVWFLEQAKQA